jgi:iron complex outermembrane recepter protein
VSDRRLSGRFCICRVLLGASLLLQAPFAAAEDSALSEQAFLQDFPVVLSASRLLQPVSEAPNAVTVIDRDMIRASGFRTIGDLFRLVPGMYVGNLNGYSPIVSYHGSTEEFSRRMQVLVDGRSVYLPPLSTVDWEDIPLHIDDIERIEVVRGPAAASYGANSLQGVINIITRDASSLSGFKGSINSGAEGVADIALHIGQTGDKVDYRLTLARQQDSGYGSSVLNDGKKTSQANLRANFHPAGADSVDFQLGFSDSTRGLGVQGKNDDIFRETTTISSFQQLSWLHAMQEGDEVKLQYYHINRNFLDPAFASLNAGTYVPSRTIADRHDLELQQTLQWSSSNRMVWGAGVRADYSESPESLAMPYNLRQSRLFAHDEWRFSSNALLNAGTMLEDDGMGHVNSSPRLAVNYHVTPQHTLRASASVAYRTPAIYEEHANVYGTPPAQPGSYVSNGGLQPEKSVSREIGYLGEFPGSGVSLEVRGYNDQVSDVIFVDPSATYWPFSFNNMFAINYYGYESTLKYRWGDGGNITINMARQFAKCEATATPTNAAALLPYGIDLVAALQGYMDECPLSVPDYSGSILLTRKIAPDIEISAGYYHSGSLKMIATVPQAVMNRIDLRVAQTIGKTGKPGSGEMALILQNAFQDDYTTYSTTQETNNIHFQRRAFVSAFYYF